MNRIVLDASRVTRALGAAAALLLLAGIGGQVSAFFLGHESLKGLVRLFDLDAEMNIPTFFRS